MDCLPPSHRPGKSRSFGHLQIELTKENSGSFPESQFSWRFQSGKEDAWAPASIPTAFRMRKQSFGQGSQRGQLIAKASFQKNPVYSPNLGFLTQRQSSRWEKRKERETPYFNHNLCHSQGVNHIWEKFCDMYLPHSGAESYTLSSHSGNLTLSLSLKNVNTYNGGAPSLHAYLRPLYLFCCLPTAK